MLADEASQLRQAAGFQGYSAFLQKPVLRARPNKQFLAATVRSVESANRMAQVSEMWHQRQKELSEEEGSGRKARGSGAAGRRKDSGTSGKDSSRRGATIKLKSPLNTEAERAVREDGRQENHAKGRHKGFPQERGNGSEDETPSEDDSDVSGFSGERPAARVHRRRRQSIERSQHALENEGEQIGPSAAGEGDDAQEVELDEFLHSRKKRGRGAVGSRMDEPGPFAAAMGGDEIDDRGTSARVPIVLGPQLPAELEEKRKREKRSRTEAFLVDHSSPSKSGKKHRTDEGKRARKEERRKRRLEKERLREAKRRKKSSKHE
ncbi:hypothetical protein KFL_004880070 [Klebsormidium nitens]|uniref:Uncharacterized protein n=1 Tax=Klebsormidium nitens TaxID=105231 RepID=A0A1Y1IGB4_KLENI|nr:hypothetical protein KFL_004880070 [Klebsormidium nitens]|eukprot:GAQ89112.1 hypothetical protein KFL_004880070 [Klebsormidium nitens]